MSYFPRTIMPLTPKEDAPLATGFGNGRSRLTSRSYNTHDEEIQAIEQFIGASDLFAAGQGVSMSLLQKVADIISDLNAFTDPYGGISTSSGNVNSGGRIIFPEPSLATYLTSFPAQADNSIAVNDTSGFPDAGIISILNDMDAPVGTPAPDVGFTNVEWVRYSSKTPTSFDGCERGYGGTFVGTHVLTPTQASSTPNNYKDYQGDSEHVPYVVQSINAAYAEVDSTMTRHFPGWRRMNLYELRILDLYGTQTDMTWKVARRAAWLSVLPSDPDFQQFSNVTGGLGLLRQRNDGTYYLESNDTSYALQGVLTWAESASVVGGLFFLAKGVDDQAWPTYAIPVFCGRLSLMLSIREATRDLFSPIDGLRIRQNATGEAYVYVANAYAPTYGDVGYHATLVASRMAEQQMDLLPEFKGATPIIVSSGASGASGVSGASGTSGVSVASGTSGTDPCYEFWKRYHRVHHWYHNHWFVYNCYLKGWRSPK